MMSDFWMVVTWWGTIFLVGTAAFPLTKLLFPSWYDRGYMFSKGVGLACVTYLVYLFASFHIVPFGLGSIVLSLAFLFGGGMAIAVAGKKPKRPEKRGWARYLVMGKVILIEELFFFAALLFWAWVKGHEASISGLEKFMDFGFTKSILNSAWFPAPDMWYSGYPINYYYFGHTVMAMLTKLSGIDLSYTFNLMLAALFAWTLTMSFSIGCELSLLNKKAKRVRAVLSGLLTAFLVTLAGNMQTLYAFTRGYTGEDVQPFWTLAWKMSEFWAKLPEGLERYWYANATRFIPFTIHEFPSYSFVVSDVHGHVLSLPFVLTSIALLLAMFGRVEEQKFVWLRYGVYGLFVSVLLTTNALDGPIYLSLFLMAYVVMHWGRFPHWRREWKTLLLPVVIVVGVAGVASMPFLSHFVSFVSGVAVNCPPWFVANSKTGFLLFEGVEKCQKSPFWMMALLWGFFWYCGLWWILSKVEWKKAKLKVSKFHISFTKFTQSEALLVIFFVFSILLLIFPEFFYFKDIYPAHFRSNTMFKLGYDAYILFSILSAYAIVRLFGKHKVFYLLLVPQLFLVSIYPIFSVRSYFDSLRHYQGIDGIAWLAEKYPEDYMAIEWFNRTVLARNRESLPVIVEADGDSYTDYARYSTFTGLPTVIGWAVHEWLWRGTYDVVAPRREDVRLIYESADDEQTRQILSRYNVSYIIVGTLERQKYPALLEEKFERLGTRVYAWGNTHVYLVDTVKDSP